MKEHFLQLAQYNNWANSRMIQLLKTLPDSILQQEMVSSFASLRLTAIHMWSAEDMWLQRLNLTENPIWQQNTFTGSFDEALVQWQKASADLIAFVQKQYNDQAFTHVVQYYNLQKKSFKNEVEHILTHVFNHSSQHRGQLITMLRQAGVTKIPPVDFIFYIREKK